MMALPGSGPISIGNIRTELNNAGTSNFSLAKAGQQFNALIGSGYVPLNNASTSKPNTSSPFQISEWFSYDHSSNRSCGLTFFSAATQIDKYYYQRFLITGCGVGCNSPIRITYTNAPPNNLSPRTDYIQLFGSYPFNNVGTLIGTPVISLALGFGQAGTYDYEWTVSSASEVVYVVSWADDPFDVYGSGPYDVRIGCGTPTNTPTPTRTPTPTPSPIYSPIQYSNQEASGTYWGGSYFIDSNLLVQRNGVEVLRVTTPATGTIGVNFIPGDTVLAQAYSFFTTFPPPATGTATLSLVISKDGEVFFTSTIPYTTGPTEPTTITTSFTVVLGGSYSISSFTSYTPATPTPTPTPPVTPTKTPSVTPTPTQTPTSSPIVSYSYCLGYDASTCSSACDDYYVNCGPF